jgi:putative ABC transport system permease protein
VNQGAAVWLRFRAELRTRWRAWVGLGLLTGLAAGAVLALVAGGRRTDSAYSRFIDGQAASDFVVVNYPGDGTTIFDFAELAALPMVADSERSVFEYIGFGSAGGTPGIAPTKNARARIDRVGVIEGRLPDARRADEIAVSFDVAESNRIQVGSEVHYIAPGQTPVPGTSEFEALSRDEQEDLIRILDAFPGLRLTVVGIVAAPGEFPPAAQGIPCCVHLSRAFADLDVAGGEVLSVRLRERVGAERAFLRALQQRSEGLPFQVLARRDETARVQRSIRVQAVGLWILAGLTALVAVLVVGQLIARSIAIHATDSPLLDALGMTRRQRFGLGLLGAGSVGIVAGIVGIAVAIALSPLFPAGVARHAELDNGVHLDSLVVLGGSLVTFALVVVLAVVPAWRTAHVVHADPPVRRSSGRMARLVALRTPVPMSLGIRMVTERGRGRSALPIGTSVLAIVLGITSLVGALTFGASLDHLLETPALYGQTWDLAVTNFEQEPPLAETLLPELRGHDDVSAVALFGPGIELWARGEPLGRCTRTGTRKG